MDADIESLRSTILENNRAMERLAERIKVLEDKVSSLQAMQGPIAATFGSVIGLNGGQ